MEAVGKRTPQAEPSRANSLCRSLSTRQQHAEEWGRTAYVSWRNSFRREELPEELGDDKPSKSHLQEVTKLPFKFRTISRIIGLTIRIFSIVRMALTVMNAFGSTTHQNACTSWTHRRPPNPNFSVMACHRMPFLWHNKTP